MEELFELYHCCDGGYWPTSATVLGRSRRGPLDPVEVAKALKLEIVNFKQTGVYRKIPIQETRDGQYRVLQVRWLDVKRADGADRSRLVAKDLKTDKASKLFAATPPIE